MTPGILHRLDGWQPVALPLAVVVTDGILPTFSVCRRPTGCLITARFAVPDATVALPCRLSSTPLHCQPTCWILFYRRAAVPRAFACVYHCLALLPVLIFSGYADVVPAVRCVTHAVLHVHFGTGAVVCHCTTLVPVRCVTTLLYPYRTGCVHPQRGLFHCRPFPQPPTLRHLAHCVYAYPVLISSIAVLGSSRTYTRRTRWWLVVRHGGPASDAMDGIKTGRGRNADVARLVVLGWWRNDGRLPPAPTFTPPASTGFDERPATVRGAP